MTNANHAARKISHVHPPDHALRKAVVRNLVHVRKVADHSRVALRVRPSVK